MTLKKIKPFVLPCLVSIVICLTISGFTGWITQSHITTWYTTLQKPSFNPPAYIFGPVWTILYIMIGMSGGILWYYRNEAANAFIFYVIQLIFNFCWSFIFFSAHQIGWALVDMLCLILFLLLTIICTFKKFKLAAILLLPYLAWVLFACVLNSALWVLN